MNIVLQSIILAESKENIQLKKSDRWQPCPAKHKARRRDTAGERFYHFYEYNADHTVLQHLGVRGERYKLIYFYTVNEWELYDLKNDPHEQKNLIRHAAYQPTFTIMKKELIKQRKLYDDHEPAGELK